MLLSRCYDQVYGRKAETVGHYLTPNILRKTLFYFDKALLNIYTSNSSGVITAYHRAGLIISSTSK